MRQHTHSTQISPPAFPPQLQILFNLWVCWIPREAPACGRTGSRGRPLCGTAAARLSTKLSLEPASASRTGSRGRALTCGTAAARLSTKLSLEPVSASRNGSRGRALTCGTVPSRARRKLFLKPLLSWCCGGGLSCAKNKSRASRGKKTYKHAQECKQNRGHLYFPL